MQGHEGDRKLLLFSVGPVACCADSFAIHRIIEPPGRLVHLPGRTHHPAIFRHEGSLVTVLDVRSLFGLDFGAKRRQPEKLIIAEIEAVLYGFWVDEVQSIISAGEGKWGMLPGVVPRTLFDAAFHYRDQLILHIDFSRLIHAEATPWVEASGLFSVEEGLEEVAESGSTEGVVANEKTAEKPSEAITEKPPSPATETNTRRSVQQPAKVKVKPAPMIRPADRKPATVAASIPKPEPRTKQETAQTGVPAPASRSSPPPFSAGTYQAEPVPSQNQPVAPRSSSIFVLGGLIFAVILLGLLLYVLWPESGQTLAERPVSQSRVIVPEIPAYGGALPLTKTPLTEAEVPTSAVSEDQEPETGENEIPAIKPSAPLTESASEEVSSVIEEDPSGPHATIERQGNMVTITLRETQAKTADESAPIAEGIPDSEDETTSLQQRAEQSFSEEEAIANRPVPEEDNGIMISGQASQTDAGSVVAEPPPVPPHARSEEIIHIVVKGDTLWDIAQRYIHDPYRYPELARLSNIKNPDLIYPGDRVRILIIRY